MANGSLRIPITDVLSEAVTGTVNVSFQPVSGSAGGFSMSTGEIDLGGSTELTVAEVECLPGPGTLYQVAIDSARFKTYSFFQMIMENRINQAPDQVRLVVNPARVKDIAAPAFGKLTAKLQKLLEGAMPLAETAEDADLAGLSGEALYEKLGPLRRAALLNLATKARHPTAAGVFRFLEGQTLLLARQDRFFSTIDPGIETFLPRNDQFKSAPGLLHKPLPGYERRASFKSKDPHANLQVSLMRDPASGKMAADIDIDENTGVEHGFEVIRNKFKGKTNPYLVRELLVLGDVQELTLDPGYRFVLG